MANAIPSYGSLVSINDSFASASFTVIAEMNTVGDYSRSATVKDVTVHNTGSPWMDFIPTLLRMDPITITVNFLPANNTHNFAAGLMYICNNREKRKFRWLLNSDAGSGYGECGFYVTKGKVSATVDGVYVGTFELTPTGVPVEVSM